MAAFGKSDEGRRISAARSLPTFFSAYSSEEAATGELVETLRSKLDRRINGSVLASVDASGARITVSEKDRSASNEFWMSVAGPLQRFLATVPGLVQRDLGAALAADGLEQASSYIFQVQWLTSRKANYWHQDVRWKTHWDAVLFLYVGESPTATDLAAVPEAPTTNSTPKEYVKFPDGHPEISARTSSGDLVTHRPALRRGDVVVLDNRRVWHRTSPSLTEADDSAAQPDDALMTIRVKALR
mmetsp:Transcript_21649/g.73357  ORF Transcript_21649/g.73357 Transcript_21649/m.73357 type:complete len:243 (-) Transcript_21649:211-939(-)